MEFASPLINVRAQLCVVMTGYAPSIDREAAWPDAADEFLRRLNKHGVQITIVGPRPPRKFGTKKSVRFLDRHEVVGMKVLEASRTHRLEFRIHNSKTKAWTRLRSEACVTIGSGAVWPIPYPGWTLPGTLTIDALARWLGEQKWPPGREIVFLGSSNRAVRWASTLLDRGARSCTIVEPSDELRCWRAHRDRFISKGGRVLPANAVQRVERDPATGILSLYLSNEQGTMIVNADTIVLCPKNDDSLNSPEQWRKGLFYAQQRTSAWDTLTDEEQWFERLDWRELYWRVARVIGVIDHNEAEGALRGLRSERRELLAYRRDARISDLSYSGKILSRETLARVQKSVSVPKTFAGRPQAVASLECLENLPCRACADACPEAAISIERLVDLPNLIEDRCTGCGACVAACPAGAAVMVRDMEGHQRARYFLPDDSKELWREGRAVDLLNRRGEPLGIGRVVSSTAYEGGSHRILEVESTDVHLWEARGFRAQKERVDDTHAAGSPTSLKRGWVTLNGVRRLCPIDVPITVALWQLGRKRFEDALFCHDGGCRLCEVVVDGRPALACQTLARDGQDIAFETTAQSTETAATPCPCRSVPAEQPATLKAEGVPESMIREVTGLGQGTCHGRWCLSCPEAPADGKRVRPVFHGYETSPWRDLWSSDVVDPPGNLRGEADED